MLENFGIAREEILNKRLVEIDSPVKHLTNQYRELIQPVLEGKSPKASYTTYVRTGDTRLVAENEVKPIIIKDKIEGLLLDTTIINRILNFDFYILRNELNLKPAAIIHDNMPSKGSIYISEIEELIDNRNQLITQVFYRCLIHKLPDMLINNKKLFSMTFGYTVDN